MTECITWAGSTNGKGYGNAWRDGKVVGAHRYEWERQRGPIPEGMWVLHDCDNRACVNIDHLYLGTARDNTRDAIERGRWSPYTSKPWTHCKRGHPLTPDNTYRRPHGRQQCRICRRAREASYA